MGSRINPLFVMIAVALLLGISASVGIWKYLNNTQEEVKKLSAMKSVIVAIKEIKAGAKITKENLGIKEIPAQAIIEGSSDSAEAFLGRFAKSTIQKEEILTESRLVKKGSAGGLSIVIPENMRAITIKVNDVVGVGGFINPGDHVDVISVYKNREVANKDGSLSEGEAYSKIILQNVLVLATADKIYDPSNLSESVAMIVEQVTLALPPTDAEKLTLAFAKSLLHLTLRPYGESKIAKTYGVTPEEVYEFSNVPDEQNVAQTFPVSARAYKDSVEVILGNERSYFNY